MTQSKTKRAVRIVAGTFLAVMAVSCYIGTATLLKFVFVKWWLPASIAFGISAASGLTLYRMWKWLTGRSGFVLNYLCHLSFFTGFLMALMLVINYCVPADKPFRHEKAVVTKVYREKHYRTRRVSRRVYSRGAPYYVYRADLRLDNGNTSTINLDMKHYNSLNKGDSVGIVVGSGIFGWEELRADSIQYPAYKKKKHPRRPRHRYSIPSENDNIHP